MGASRYKVTIIPSALRTLQSLPQPFRERIRDKNDSLADDPRPHGVRALQGGQKGLLRLPSAITASFIESKMIVCWFSSSLSATGGRSIGDNWEVEKMMATPTESTSPSGQFRWRSLSRILTCVLLGLIVLWLGLLLGWDYLPGTLSFDGGGFPHGTGTRQYFYKSGRLKLEESYRAGLLVRGTWYRPDGSVLITAEMNKKSGGVWYYLYEDGTIRAKEDSQYDAQSGLYLAERTTVYYKPDGTVERTVRFHRGIPVNSGAGSDK